jgi:hypothetical protein
MGLLDIWNDWKRNNQGTVQDDFSGMNSDAMSPNLNTAGGIDNPSYRRKESPLIKNPIFPEKYVPPGQGKIVLNPDGTNKVLPNEIQMFKPENQPQGTPVGKATDPITQGGTGVKFAEDQGFLSKLSNMAGVDMDKAAANWKDKGGFEGLMSNPAFSLGLALMQSSANGKTINQGILDNFVKSAKISAEFKDRIEARKQEPIQATAADISETKNILSKVGVSEGNWFENFGSRVKNIFGKGGSKNPGLDFDKAVEEISIQYQLAIQKKQKELKQAGKSTVIRIDDKIKIMDDLVKSGKIQKNESFFSKIGITDATIQKREQGGSVESGKPYVVGEKGPEIIIPTSDGNVLSNDDSQIFNMLLASNPQLQKVSKQRAERILKARFPEYFEG